LLLLILSALFCSSLAKKHTENKNKVTVHDDSSPVHLPSQENTRSSNNDTQCNLCEFLANAAELDIRIESHNYTQVIDELERVCQDLPSRIQHECGQMIADSGDRLVELLYEGKSVHETCFSLALCEAPAQVIIPANKPNQHHHKDSRDENDDRDDSDDSDRDDSDDTDRDDSDDTDRDDSDDSDRDDSDDSDDRDDSDDTDRDDNDDSDDRDDNDDSDDRDDNDDSDDRDDSDDSDDRDDSDDSEDRDDSDDSDDQDDSDDSEDRDDSDDSDDSDE